MIEMIGLATFVYDRRDIFGEVIGGSHKRVTCLGNVLLVRYRIEHAAESQSKYGKLLQ